MISIKEIFKSNIPPHIKHFTLLWRYVHGKNAFPLYLRSSVLGYKLSSGTFYEITPATMKNWFRDYGYLEPTMTETFDDSMLEIE